MKLTNITLDSERVEAWSRLIYFTVDGIDYEVTLSYRGEWDGYDAVWHSNGVEISEPDFVTGDFYYELDEATNDRAQVTR